MITLFKRKPGRLQAQDMRLIRGGKYYRHTQARPLTILEYMELLGIYRRHKDDPHSVTGRDSTDEGA